MKIFTKALTVTLAVFFVLGASNATFAATSVNLGDADNFAVLAGSKVTNTGSSVVNGDLGSFPTATITGFLPGVVNGTNHAGDGITQGAKTDLITAYNTAADETPTSTVASELGSTTKVAGAYDSEDGTFEITGTLTLDAQGDPNAIFVFKTATTLTTAGSSSINLLNDAQACNVFWQVGSSATLGTDSTFVGNILALTSITLTTGADVNGRVLARNGAVTLDTNTITKAVCEAPAENDSPATINVVKVVINDNGGTKTVADFPLFVNGKPVVSGVTNTFPTNGNVYTITETNDANYTRTFSGDCDANGQLNLNPGFNRFCIVTNNDKGAVIAPIVPPLIDLVKIPSPLALPSGPGSVLYTYTLKNIGTVPVTDITLVGDSCSPITLFSGDVNGDAKLGLNETWVYRCTTTLTQTHTNTVVATGWANGISATDIASATVVVGAPIVPPLIHVTKVPSPLVLPAGGGKVVYTKTVTNPGTVALSNIILTDDKCSPVNFISGDTNRDGKLDVNESWIYSCNANLTQTTTNTVTASGQANGLTARDFAIATVVVAAPKLPNTGIEPNGHNTLWYVFVLAGIFTASIFLFAIRKNSLVQPKR